MRGIQRSQEPPFFHAIRCRYEEWDELYDASGYQIRDCRNSSPYPCCRPQLQGMDGEDIRREIRNALRTDFNGICAYCEQDCARSITTIEHFRPREHFSAEWLTWLNLMYSCQRCDNQKGESWPGPTGNYDLLFSYINPNLSPDQKPAEDFFEFADLSNIPESDGFPAVDMVAGQIIPASNLTPSEWWRANLTIQDLDLNSDSNHVASGQERLPLLRKVYLDSLLDFIESKIGDLQTNIDVAADILWEHAQPGNVFSSYVLAFVRSLDT